MNLQSERPQDLFKALDFLFAIARCAQARGASLWTFDRHAAMREFQTADLMSRRAFALRLLPARRVSPEAVRTVGCTLVGIRAVQGAAVCSPRGPDRGMKPLKHRHPLPPEVAEHILLHPAKPVRTIAAEFHCSQHTVLAVRRGETHQDLCPELPRIQGCPSCWECKHAASARRPGGNNRRPECRLEIPDIQVHGPRFAIECLWFAPRPKDA